MKKIIGLLIIITYSHFINAQEVIMGEIVKNKDDKKYGPNRTHFVHTYIGLSFPITSEDDRNEIETIKSHNFHIGSRYKLKLNNTFSTGLDISYIAEKYKIKKTINNNFFDWTDYSKKVLYLNKIGCEVYIRTNFGRRGDRVGKHIDIGYLLAYNIRDRIKTIYKSQNRSFTKMNQFYYADINPYNQYISCRLAFNNIIFFYNYRLDNIFDLKYFKEYPRNNFGIQIGMYK